MQKRSVTGRINAAGQLIAGILVILVIIGILQNILGFVQMKTAPPGWQIIRPPYEVSTLIVVNNTVWTGGKDGVILIDRVTGEKTAPPGTVPSFGYVRQIFCDRTGDIWVAHDGGLAMFRDGAWQVIAPAPGVPFSRALSIAEQQKGSIIIGTDTDVFALRQDTWSSVLRNDAPSVACAEVLLADRDDNIWIGCGLPTRGGLYRLNGTSWSSYSLSDGLPHNSVRGMTQARDGTIWVATGFSRHGGAAVFRNGTWSNLTVADGLAGESTRSVFEDGAGRMWIGSEYDGIAAGSYGSWKIFTERDGLAGYEVKIMAQDSDGTYWLGTNSGLSRISRDAVFPPAALENPG